MMSNKTRNSRRTVSSNTRRAAPFLWPLNKTTTPDEMNTSFGPRIDADRWDFHDGIDLPAPIGTPVHAMAAGTIHRAGPADNGFGSTHVLLKVVDPTDGEEDLFLVYLHLDSIAEGVTPGVHVNQGDVIGSVGQEDATYPHLHFEFRKGGPQQRRSVHPLHYLPYLNTANFRQLRLDRCNFSRDDDGEKRVVRLSFAVRNRREGDVQAVHVALMGGGVATRELHVDFDDREAINSDNGDEHAFKNGIAVEGYQKSNLKGERLNDLRYGVLVEDITPEYDSVTLRVLDVKNEKPKNAEFNLPTLEAGTNPVNSRTGFEAGETFPPPGWELRVLPGNVCRPDPTAAVTGARGLLCQDLQSVHGTLVRAGLRFPLPVNRSPVRPMSWRVKADINFVELEVEEGLVVHPLAFLIGDTVVAAACLRKIGNDEFVTGVLIRSADGYSEKKLMWTRGKLLEISLSGGNLI